MHEDRVTNTVEDAARYEQIRGAEAFIDDRPTRRELDADEAAAGRATSITTHEGVVLSIRLGRHGLYGITVVPAREHVYRVEGVESLDHEAWSKIDTEFEAKTVDGVVWVKWTDPVPTEPPF